MKAEAENSRSSLQPHALFGLAAVFAFTMIQAGIKWEWLLLMDEIQYLERMPRVTNVFNQFVIDFWGYWHQGRLHPVKYLANLIRWCWLPMNTQLYHWLNYFLLMGAVVLGVKAILDSVPAQIRKTRPLFPWLLFGAGLMLAQRPILDIAALSTIPEGWVVLFFVLGLRVFPKRQIGYRLALLLCAFSKEVAIVIFFATAVAHLLRRRKVEAAVDFAIFGACALLMWIAKNAGHYTDTYSLTSLETLGSFGLALLKIGIGATLPLVGIALSGANSGAGTPEKALVKALTNERIIVCILFSGMYLYLAAARAAAGYLILPSAFALGLAGFGVFLYLPLEWSGLGTGARTTVAILFFGILSTSLVRYQNFVRSFNEPSKIFRELLMVNTPRLILINGSEASGLGANLAKTINPKVQVGELTDNSALQLENAPGDVVLLELSSYFGRVSTRQLQTLGDKIGGWAMVEDRGAYRIFYGHR